MTKLSGATQQSLAQLLDKEATHSVIESLYLRFDVDPIADGSTPNKLRKATHLVRVLNGREEGDALRELITYLGSPSSGMNPAFLRGSAQSEDLYINLDRDSGASMPPRNATSAPVGAKPSFARPGTAAPALVPAQSAKRYVFVVRGRDNAAYDALEAFLVALDLRVVTWDEATRGAGGGTPHTLDIVRAGIEMSDAVVVLMTPDDLGKVKPEFHVPGRDDPREATQSGQARQNVIFEAGWAMALNQQTVILVRVGDVRPLSDIDGLNYVWLANDISARRQLITRLRNCHLDVDDRGESWRTAGTFPEPA